MAINSNELRFTTSSILGYIDGRWVLTDAVINGGGHLVIQPGGSAVVSATQSIINSNFAYGKLYIRYKSTYVTSENNFKSGPSVLIDEIYKKESNEIYRNKTRCVGFNTYKVLDEINKVYEDTTIYKTLNKPMAKLVFKIVNDSEEELTIESVGLYTSVDVSEGQVGDIVNNVIKSGEPVGFVTYTTAGYESLIAIGVKVSGSDTQLIFKPTYFNGLMTAIETNFGISYTNIYVEGEPDMEA